MTSSFRTEGIGRIVCLVIEDHHDSAAVLEAILRGWRIETRTAATVNDARLLLQTEPPDVIICDLKLPGEDGLSFVRWLRSQPNPELSRIPAIAMTAHHEQFTTRDVRASGFDLYLTKPLDFDNLPHQVMLLVGRRQSGESSCEARRGREPTC